ncbi:hypothetical protein OAN81_03310 [Paracoccaceae bacterium]|nr:hypothetical protein [Paracoccaceae bacterium]
MNEDNPRAGWSALLPDAWAWATFGDVAIDLTDSKRKLAKKSYQPAGRFPVIDQGEEFANGFSDEDGLVSKASLPCVVWGDHTRRSKFVKTPFIQGADGVKVLVPSKAVLPDFFFKQITFAELPDKGYSRHYKFLKAKEFPLPPLFEQRRIVRKLDTLSARTTTAYTHLSAIAKLVDKYKAGFVSAIFKGLSEQFGAIELGSICDRITKGSSPKWQGFEYSDEGAIFVRSQNVLWGKLNLSDVTRLPAEFNEKQRNSVMERNDVLLNIVGASIGRSAVVPNELVGANCNQAVAVIRLLEPNFEDASYLSQWLISPGAQSQITENAVDVARANFSLGQAKKLLIPWATTEARKSALIKIQAAFAKIDLLAAEAEKALKLTDRLDQRILAKAFSGELIPQESTDEPASVLLNRIRAERASAPKPERGRKKKADA